MPQQFPPGTIEALLQARLQAWASGQPDVAYIYAIPRLSDDRLERAAPTFTPVCTQADC